MLSIVYLAIATRTLGLADFGGFALVVAIGQGISGVVGFQTRQFVVRYEMRAQSNGDSDDDGVDRIIGFAAALDLGAAILGSAVAIDVDNARTLGVAETILASRRPHPR